MTISVQYEDVLVTSAHHGQGDTIVSAATHDIGQLLSRLMEKLDERATTLACGAQFDLALRDAAMMRTLAPGSSLGYLRAGSIYQEQGRQRAAVMMYDQGLDRVPSCDPCYTQLGQCRSHALKEEDTKRVDFISRLPMDIIATTLIPLLFDPLETTLGRLSPLLSVSHTWRQSILQCNILTLVVDRSMMTPNEFEQSVEAYVPYVKSLFVKRTPVEESANDVVDLLVKAHFPAIRHLDLDCHRMHMFLFLDSMSPTLTHLKISLFFERIESADAIHLMSDILDRCPHLVSFDMEWLDIATPLTLTHDYPKLTHLGLLDIIGDSNIYNCMENILSHLPSLLTFCVHPMPDSRILPTIHQHCPKLKVIRYGDNISTHFVKDNQQQGLQELTIGPHGTKYSSDVIVSTLAQYSESLQELDLRGDSVEDDDTAIFSSKSQLVLRKLSQLYVSSNNDSILPLASWIIRHAPHLRTIMAHQLAGGNNDDLINAITGLSHLQRLSVMPMSYHSQSFCRLIEHHVQLGNRSTLRELEISISNLSQWMIPLTHLGQLRSLKIIIFSGVPPSDIKAIISALSQGLPLLESLVLRFTFTDIPDGAISACHVHPTIQSLILRATSMTDKDLLSLIKFPKLQSLVLDVPVKDYILELLRTKIAHVEYR